MARTSLRAFVPRQHGVVGLTSDGQCGRLVRMIRPLHARRGPCDHRGPCWASMSARISNDRQLCGRQSRTASFGFGSIAPVHHIQELTLASLPRSVIATAFRQRLLRGAGPVRAKISTVCSTLHPVVASVGFRERGSQVMAGRRHLSVWLVTNRSRRTRRSNPVVEVD
jgi:hypothetical protein